jgi:L,D-peptidoglycan transpeptidase YkuD (ErfK/YbiS/YcfS/YnhG family)
MPSTSTSLLVAPDSKSSPRGKLHCGGRVLPCVLGRTGVKLQKQEGDGATPVGTYALRRVLYRADRVERPMTALPVSEILRDDGWCDDPADPRYNKPVKLPYPASAESMWRDDSLYDVVVIIGHNDAPVVPNAGSAIFLHVAPSDGGATAGCVALARDDLLWVLQKVRPDTLIEISIAD